MIHIISREYYLKHKYNGKFKKILIESQTFPIKNKYLMKDGICFIYLMDLGFLIVPESSGFDKSILNEEISKSEWYIEKYEKPLNLTKNYINSFVDIKITETQRNKWIFDYCGYIRVWNILTSEDFIFYFKTDKKHYPTSAPTSNSYICKLVIGDKVKFPIDINYVEEFNNFIKDIIEWT